MLLKQNKKTKRSVKLFNGTMNKDVNRMNFEKYMKV